MRYISCFSGIGGLEATVPPILYCETDPACQLLLKQRYPGSLLHDDIRTLIPPKVDVVAGGWPCQDLSIAGKQAGLNGKRSKLLSELLRVAQQAEATCLVAENVPHLLRMKNGREFSKAIRLMHEAGFEYVGWRLLNARQFGLPQNRTRLILVASKLREHVFRLFRSLPCLTGSTYSKAKAIRAAGFYWTAGTHSINYSAGYVPALKIGSSVGIASLPAIHFGNTVRSLTPIESLRLQGFDDFAMQFSNADLLRMVGNAVPKPLGAWAVDTVATTACDESFAAERICLQTAFYFGREQLTAPDAGYSVARGKKYGVVLPRDSKKATNLIDFIDTENTSMLSSRAASGLLRRLAKSGQVCPNALRAALRRLAGRQRQ